MRRAGIITGSQLRDMLEKGVPVTVLDVRPAHDRNEWYIPGSLHIDAYWALWANDPKALSGIDLPRDRPVVAVCAAGRTSLIAASQLAAQGFDAYSLEGGMRAWSLAWNTAHVALPDPQSGGASVIQVRRTGKGCLSYIIASDGQAAVIDASVEPQVYIDIARSNGWRIEHVLDTHVHADHLSRSRRLAHETGATLWLPQQRRVSYDFSPLADGSTVQIGQASIEALHTPGHTSESMCYLLEGRALFTGDTLFLNSVGRPDLEAGPDETRARAGMLYRSLLRLMEMPPTTLILPGHTDKPVPFDDRPLTAPLAEVRSKLPILEGSEGEFVELIASQTPLPPPNYHRIMQLNEAGAWPEEDPAELEAGANRCAIT